MRILLPDLQGKDLFNYLVTNKKELIRKKKLLPIKSDPIFATTERIIPLKTETQKDGKETQESIDTGEFLVDVVGNSAWWCDSHMDVLTDTCYDKSVREQGALLPHIKDHDHVSTSHVGDVQEVYNKRISLKRLGLDMPGSTTSVLWKTLIKKDYDEKVYKFYKAGKMNQHSIGLQYLSIGLCINDKDYLPEFELWGKYYDKVINKSLIDEKMFFWIVPEIKIFENSCVLLGANQLTPTYATESKELEDITEPLPAETTTEQPKLKKLNFKPFKN
jgi:hypothetical protein